MSFPVVTSQRPTAPSSPAVAMVFPSGDQATLHIVYVTPVKLRIGFPVVASHRRKRLCKLVEAISRLFGDHAKFTIWSSSPGISRVLKTLVVAKSHSWIL